MVPTGKDGGCPLLSLQGMQNGPCALGLHWILVACHSVRGIMMMHATVIAHGISFSRSGRSQ